jgi:hypothetical protein
MEWIIWVCLWIFAAIPSGKLVRSIITRGDASYFLALVRFLLTIVLATFIFFETVNDGLMWWIWILWVLGWTVYELLASKEGDFVVFGIILTVFIVIFIVGIGVTSFCAGNNNAIYFDSFIVKSEGFPIQSEVPDDKLRITTEELAKSITSQHMGEFGSAVKIINSHLGLPDNRLAWLSTTAKQEQWGATFKTTGLVAIDANDPDRPVTTIDQKFNIAEGLDFNPFVGAWGSSVAKGYYDIDTSLCYGDTYPALNPETKEWSMIMTTYQPDSFFVRKYSGIYELNPRGDVINKYDRDIPKWIIEPYDEQVFLEQGIADWGNHRRGDGFDLWAGGVLGIAPSNDRLAITEDTRYVYDPDTDQIIAMVMVHPIRDKGELSLAGVFKVTSKGIFYYDLKQYDLMSGIAASSVTKSKITARANSNYFTAMELLYPLQVDNQTRYAYFVPIYYTNVNSNVIGLAGLGIVDAQSADKVIVEYTGEGVTGETLIKKAKESFRNLYRTGGTTGGVPTVSGTINGTLINKYEPYVKNGNTQQWVYVKTKSGYAEYLIRSDLLNDPAMLKIQKLQPGETVELSVDNSNIVSSVR